jgi:hypothetical protein
VGRDIFARFLPDIPSAVGIFAPDLIINSARKTILGGHL